MEVPETPRWFATPDGGTLYALLSPDRLVEHQRLGGRYLHHVFEVKTYADRLHLASLLERLEQGLLEGLTREEYDGRVRNIERLERLGPRGN